MKIESGDWVVVFDGGKALFLQNDGSALHPRLKAVETHEHTNPKSSEQGSDRPGRVHESASAGRSGVEQKDWHEESERKFIGRIADRLDNAVASSEVAQLIVVAPPHALGIFRKHASDAVRKLVKAEVDKDYVKKTPHEIETLLAR